jgi:hypothetical protein
MSMHYYMPDRAVLVEPCTLFCTEYSQKMRISTDAGLGSRRPGSIFASTPPRYSATTSYGGISPTMKASWHRCGEFCYVVSGSEDIDRKRALARGRLHTRTFVVS